MTIIVDRSRAPDAGHHWIRPTLGILVVVLGIAAMAMAVDRAIGDYRDRIALSGLGGKPSPVDLTIAGEHLAIPANMIRFRAARRGGEADRVDLLLRWPDLTGFSEEDADAFKDTSPSAPLIYLSIAARTSPLDASSRLDPVYSRFFTGPAIPGPDGLIGKALKPESGYRGEIVYFMPKGVDPFATRCLAEETPEIPATCIRDVNVGTGLSMLYRFNVRRLADWRAMDAGLQALVRSFLARPS
ncbi:MAG TPA: hypothetical protein VFB16_14880 [Bauldia sp.]|nr:hypothetical protein [Bauldia sp.]